MRSLLHTLALQAAFLALAAAQAAAPVIVDGQQLWSIEAPRAGLTAADRAQDVAANITALAGDTRRSLSDVRDVHLATESILLVSRVYLFSVTDQDAQIAGRPRAGLFAEHKRTALEAIERYRRARSWNMLLRGAGLAALGLIAGFAALLLLRTAHRHVAMHMRRHVARLAETGAASSILKAFETSLLRLLRFALSLVFLIAAAGVAIVTLSFALGQFPATAGVADAATAMVLRVAGGMVHGIVGYLPNLVVLLLVGALTHVLVRAARGVFRALGAGRVTLGGFHPEWAKPTYDLVKILLVVFALVVAFPYLPGGDSPALKGASIFIGVLVSLGSGSAMGNVISGVILTYMRPYQLGDRVRIADTIGDIVEKSLLVTRIRTIKNVEIIIPNSSVLGAHILNYSANARQSGLILNTTVTIGYDAPWRTVHELLIRAALRTTSVLAEPKPFVLQTALNDFNVSYEINAYTNDANRMAVTYSELHQNIQEEFNAAGVEIMSPNYFALRDGNTVTIPEQQRPAGYTPPKFRVQSGAE